jgi:hypothetical protein
MEAHSAGHRAQSRTMFNMDNVELAIILAVVTTILVTLLWLGRQLYLARATARKTSDQASDAINLTEASLALTKEQIVLQTEANKLMRDLIEALRNSR